MTSIRESREMVRKRRPSVLIHKQHNDGSSSFGGGQQVEGWRDGKQHLGLKAVVCLLFSNRTARVTFPSETTSVTTEGFPQVFPAQPWEFGFSRIPVSNRSIYTVHTYPCMLLYTCVS